MSMLFKPLRSIQVNRCELTVKRECARRDEYQDPEAGHDAVGAFEDDDLVAAGAAFSRAAILRLGPSTSICTRLPTKPLHFGGSDLVDSVEQARVAFLDASPAGT